MKDNYYFFNIKLTAEESIKIINSLKGYFDVDVYSNKYEYCGSDIRDSFEYIENEIVSMFNLDSYVGYDISIPIFQCINAIEKHTKIDRIEIQNNVIDWIFYYHVQDYFTEITGVKEVYEYCNGLEEYVTRYGTKTARELKSELKYKKMKKYKLYENLELQDDGTMTYSEPIFDYSEGENVLVGREELKVDIEEEKYNYVHEAIQVMEKELRNSLNELTKNDTEVNRESLLYDEVIQAFNTSITKFIELYYQQPRELKHTLIDYKETPIKDYIAVTQNAINHDKDIKLLYKIFPTYKRDTQGRIYNYDLFAFLYYAYGLEISFNHLYHSELLKCLGAYTFKAGRDKPILKKNAVAILQQHKEAVKLTQYSENIYLHNFIAFIKTVNTRHYIRYLLSLLVDISNNLNASKELISRFTLKNKGLKNISYKDLPQPINTLLLPLTEIAN